MSVDEPTIVQILLVWDGKRWVVSRNTIEVGAYAYRTHAMEMARRLSAQAAHAGLSCYMLIREKEGAWLERPCPRPSGSRGGPPSA